jgi:AraC-like DNA-binding protein
MSHFGRVFRDRYGLTPREFRNRLATQWRTPLDEGRARAQLELVLHREPHARM